LPKMSFVMYTVYN